MTSCRSTTTFSSELRHKYNVHSILIRKDDEIDNGSSSGAVDEGRRAVAVDDVVEEESPAGRRLGGRWRTVGFILIPRREQKEKTIGSHNYGRRH